MLWHIWEFHFCLLLNSIIMWWDFDFSLEALACWGECHIQLTALHALWSMWGRKVGAAGVLQHWFSNGIPTLPASAASPRPEAFSPPLNPSRPFLPSGYPQLNCTISGVWLTFWQVRTVTQTLPGPQAFWPPVSLPSVLPWHSQCMAKASVDTGVGA